MRFHQTTAKSGTKLRRLAALLCALADLAELAGGRCGAVCLLVIWLIRPSEVAARDYVDKIAPGVARLPAPVRPLDGAAEALRLARSLRFLAAILAALADACLAPLPAAPANREASRRVAPSPAMLIPWSGRQPCPP
jgi:hypothetical protein